MTNHSLANFLMFVDEVGREHHVMFRLSPWATVIVDATT
jgi:hypothetical protein